MLSCPCCPFYIIDFLIHVQVVSQAKNRMVKFEQRIIACCWCCQADRGDSPSLFLSVYFIPESQTSRMFVSSLSWGTSLDVSLLSPVYKPESVVKQAEKSYRLDKRPEALHL